MDYRFGNRHGWHRRRHRARVYDLNAVHPYPGGSSYPHTPMLDRPVMCQNYSGMSHSHEIASSYSFWHQEHNWNYIPPVRRRIKCQVCGRRVIARQYVDHDGTELLLLLPPHKKKGWYKKPKQHRKHDRPQGRGK